MSRPTRRTELAGSHPVHRTGAVAGKPIAADERQQVTIVLAAQSLPTTHPVARKARKQDSAWPTRCPALSLEELETLESPTDESIASVLGFATEHGLDVIEVARARRDVVLEGSGADLNRAFGIEQRHFVHEHGSYRSHDGPVSVPADWPEFVEGILGLDDAAGHRPHAGGVPSPVVPACEPDHLLSHYRFPSMGPIAGERIALLEFGGGIEQGDLEAYLTHRSVPVPPVRIAQVRDGRGTVAVNAPLSAAHTRSIIRDWRAGLPGDQLAAKHGAALEAFVSTLEVTMDAEIVAALAPAVPIDIVFAAPSADGWRRAIYGAIGLATPGSMTAPPTSLPTAISISWGMSECSWGTMKLRVLHGALDAARRLGVTVCCSTGDFGSRNSPRPSDERHVNFPASSPAVLACGGTTLEANAGAIVGERAWKEQLPGGTMASGGGMSGFFPIPPFQHAVAAPDPAPSQWLRDGATHVRGRWIPDVAASASFVPGIAVTLAGEPFMGGGTSAATPIWAALITRLATRLGSSLGGVTPALYGLAASNALRSVRAGDNDLGASADSPPWYAAADGWDPCTGLGVPNGEALLAAIREGPPEHR